ncbi:MAG: hypothetical protein KTR24_12115, partial [Saprospiraceae bacterium]|nr:hypothetical protein [Saprospiraceae bacterium]
MSLWCSTETGRPCPRVLFMFLLSGWLGVAPAQVMTDNDEGERILLMPDGSWRYLEPGDSIYLYQGPGEENLLKYYTYLSAAELFEGEVMDVVDNTQEKLYTLENRYDKARSDGDIYRLSSLRTEREELQTQLSSQQDQLQYVRSLIKDIKKIGTRKKYQKLDKIEIPERYLTEASSDAPSAAYAYNDGSTLEAPDGEASQISGSKRKERTRSSIRKDRDIVSREQKEEEKSTSGEQGFDQAVKRKREKESRSASSEPLATSSKKSKRREAKIKEVKAKESSEDDAKVKRKSATPASQNDPVRIENAGATKASNGRYVVPNALIDEDPLPKCRFAFNGVDQFNGGVRREMEGEILFTHTDPRLKAYLKGREYVT